MRRRPLLLLLSLSLVTACGGSEHAERIIERKWSASEITQLKVNGVNSDIEVIGGTGQVVSMHAMVSADGDEAGASLRDGGLDCKVRGGVLSISEASSQRSRRFLPWIVSINRKSRYRFEVPERMALSLTNVRGHIAINGVHAPADVESVSGSIEFSGGGAPLVARTVNGSIEAHFVDQFNGAKLRTVNGAVEVRVPDVSNLVCNVSQSNGGFESNIPVTMNRSHHANGEHGAVELEVTTVNGDISLTRSEPPVPPVAPQAAPPAVPSVVPSAPPIAPPPPAPPVAATPSVDL